MKPAAAYLRCSTELQQLSISDQKKEILEFAGKMNFEVVRWFVDEGKSGVLTKGRPAFGEMTAMVESEKHDFAAVLCYDVSRWGKSFTTSSALASDIEWISTILILKFSPIGHLCQNFHQQPRSFLWLSHSLSPASFFNLRQIRSLTSL